MINSDETNKIVLFKQKEVRRQLHGGEWWFVISDVIRVLVDTENPSDYLKKVRKRDDALAELWKNGGVFGGDKLSPPRELTFKTAVGKQKIKCWNTEGIFRLVQSVPSPKAEPFKRWLAKVGFERIQEIENPELAQKRMKMLYKLKGIKRENLRDHMNDLELLFTQLGEAATTEIARTDDSQGMHENKDAAKRGGDVAGVARKQLEKQTGKPVVSEQNYLDGIDVSSQDQIRDIHDEEEK